MLKVIDFFIVDVPVACLYQNNSLHTVKSLPKDSTS